VFIKPHAPSWFWHMSSSRVGFANRNNKVSNSTCSKWKATWLVFFHWLLKNGYSRHLLSSQIRNRMCLPAYTKDVRVVEKFLFTYILGS